MQKRVVECQGVHTNRQQEQQLEQHTEIWQEVEQLEDKHKWKAVHANRPSGVI